jgi:2'-5' RNA ligase
MKETEVGRHRLFVAAVPPAAIRAALIGAMGDVAHARWQSDAQLHITLRFIGEVDRHQAEDVAVVLGHVRHHSMMLEIGSCGTFERRGRIDTIWASIQPRDRIAPLHDKIGRALGQAGLPPEGRAFFPHITLARFARTTAPDADVARSLAIPPLPTFSIERFALFESRLSAEGASYEAIAHYPLRD